MTYAHDNLLQDKLLNNFSFSSTLYMNCWLINTLMSRESSIVGADHIFKTWMLCWWVVLSPLSLPLPPSSSLSLCLHVWTGWIEYGYARVLVFSRFFFVLPCICIACKKMVEHFCMYVYGAWTYACRECADQRVNGGCGWCLLFVDLRMMGEGSMFSKFWVCVCVCVFMCVCAFVHGTSVSRYLYGLLYPPFLQALLEVFWRRPGCVLICVSVLRFCMSVADVCTLQCFGGLCLGYVFLVCSLGWIWSHKCEQSSIHTNFVFAFKFAHACKRWAPASHTQITLLAVTSVNIFSLDCSYSQGVQVWN